MAKSKGRLLSELAEAPKNEDYSDVNALPNTGNKVGDQAFVEETDRLYIWNGSGWYNIALINTTPTWDSGGQPAESYVLDAVSPQDATTITLAASDPEGIPISYSYVTGGSMDSIATVSQDSSVFTITPKTSAQAPDGGTGSITFRASDGINILPQVSSFTLNFISTIENSRYTTLLVTATGISDNNNITDASSNNHSITVNGDAHAGTFSPYRSGGYSFYGHFRPETVSSTLDTYSLSFWYRLNSVIDNARVFETQSGSFSMMIETDNSGQFSVGGAFETQNDGSGNNYLDNNWHYFVVSRTPSETNWYMDGAQITTARNGSTITTTLSSLTAQAVRNMTFGGRDASSDLGSLPTTNLADINFRDIELKSTTHDGSVPTEPVTSSSDTVFLTAHKPYSGYDYGATPTSALIETLGTNFETRSTSPYDYLEYSATDHGGSVYFDGTGDYIEHQGTFTLPAGTNANWTIECWVNLDQVNLNQGILRVSSTAAAGNNDDIYFSEQSGYINVACKAGGINSATSNYTMSANVWHHIAMVKNNGTVYLYNNGVYCGSISDSNDYSGSYYVYGGLYYSSSYCFAGHLTDFRISNSAIYTSGTSNFTPPTAPLSSSGTSLHIKGTDASIIDKSQSSNLKLVGNTTGSTTQVKFANTKSIYFDGGNSVLEIPAPGVLLPPQSSSNVSMDWTIEGWLYRTSADGQNGTVGDGIFAVNSYDEWDEYPANSNINGLSFSTKALSIGQNASPHGLSTQFTADNQWHHFALVRYYDTSGGSTYVNVYRDGTSVLQLQDAAAGYLGFDNVNTPSAFGVFDKYNGSYRYYFQGYMQDLKVSRRAVYTGAFTPPTASLEG